MSDYLTDEEQLDKLRNWWQENGLMLAGGVVLAVVGLVGWNWYGQQQAEATASASDLYVDYLNASGAERQTIESTLISNHPDSIYRLFVTLRNARAQMDEEDAAGALLTLQEALALADDEKMADVIRIRIARVQQELNQSDAALETLSDVRSMGLRSQVQELKGDIHMARGERALANESYRAALAEAGEGTPQPLLELKVSDTADANET